MSFVRLALPSAVLVSSILALSIIGCGSPAANVGEDVSSSTDELRTLAAPVDLASIDGEVLDLKVDATGIFGLVRQTNTYLVQRFSKTTGAVATVMSVTSTAASGFAMDDRNVYLLRQDAGGSSIVRGSKMGGPTQVIAQSLPTSYRLEVDATHLYFQEDGGNLVRAPKSGLGRAETFASTARPPVSFAVDADAVYWVDGGEGNPATGCNQGEGVIYRQPKLGGPAQAIVSGETCPLQLALDGNTMYWSTLGGSVRSASKRGGSVSVPAPTVYTSDRFAVADGSLAFVHATDSEDFTTTLAIGRKSPMSLVPTIHVKTRTKITFHPMTRLGTVAIDESATYYIEHSARQVGVDASGYPEWSATGTLKKVSAF
jgi:hypothetical protein